ncbi:UDP-N-acetylglucosamine 4,6-dehydratase (inverting) [Brevibacterium antiquum]|uniref:UDP-N-acetylglucosamine 4,6-dehydratase (Inverting) n=1 Tax=Brevibacterium antiquum TaxID=234835 RepID=A0A2H1KML9_9MICO|nr:UDP-N-acetylglucosamine 4,6-dehydratase (inverting) [Brevibacterium antiquum]SMY00869.1 UDP-N-acetylglucosamine 4,6-dehydratase (inverting) [Brevibacterium antiquum]
MSVDRSVIDGKSVLITGGSGSFGKKFISTILERFSPERVIVFSRDELKQFEMQTSEPFKSHSSVMRYFIGDVRDEARLCKAMEDVDVVVHAAALKQVPAAEYNPFEAVKTNVVGAENVVNAAIAQNVKRVVALSTDKAAAPINLYGATKLASDKIFAAANTHRGKRDITFSVVRYGNVLGSRGSVVPFFREHTKWGYLPITDSRMTRFNITLQRGVDFVLESLGRQWGGELFVPKIPSYRVTDVATAVAPELEQRIVGIRPGEKLDEEMITTTDAISTIEFDDYYVILPSFKVWDVDEFINKSSETPGRRCEYGFQYNSGTNGDFLSVEQIRELMETSL